MDSMDPLVSMDSMLSRDSMLSMDGVMVNGWPIAGQKMANEGHWLANGLRTKANGWPINGEWKPMDGQWMANDGPVHLADFWPILAVWLPTFADVGRF